MPPPSGPITCYTVCYKVPDIRLLRFVNIVVNLADKVQFGSPDSKHHVFRCPVLIYYLLRNISGREVCGEKYYNLVGNFVVAGGLL